MMLTSASHGVLLTGPVAASGPKRHWGLLRVCIARLMKVFSKKITVAVFYIAIGLSAAIASLCARVLKGTCYHLPVNPHWQHLPSNTENQVVLILPSHRELCDLPGHSMLDMKCLLRLGIPSCMCHSVLSLLSWHLLVQGGPGARGHGPSPVCHHLILARRPEARSSFPASWQY